MQSHGIRTFIDDGKGIAHNKLIIIEGQTLLTGSFSFTKQSAENNAENLLVCGDSAIGGKFTTNCKFTSRTVSHRTTQKRRGTGRECVQA